MSETTKNFNLFLQTFGFITVYSNRPMAFGVHTLTDHHEKTQTITYTVFGLATREDFDRQLKLIGREKPQLEYNPPYYYKAVAE